MPLPVTNETGGGAFSNRVLLKTSRQSKVYAKFGLCLFLYF